MTVEDSRTAGSGGKPERAVLVGVDQARGGQRRGSRAGVAGARLASVRPDADSDPLDLVELAAIAPNRTELDAEESLAEFRELVSSAGGVVVAEVMQRRARLDPGRRYLRPVNLAHVRNAIPRTAAEVEHYFSPTAF